MEQKKFKVSLHLWCEGEEASKKLESELWKVEPAGYSAKTVHNREVGLEPLKKEIESDCLALFFDYGLKLEQVFQFLDSIKENLGSWIDEQALEMSAEEHEEVEYDADLDIDAMKEAEYEAKLQEGEKNG